MPSIGSCPAPFSLGPWPLITLASSSLMCGAETKVHGDRQSHLSGYKSFFLPFGDEVSRQVIFIAGLRREPSEKINKVTHTSPSHASAPSLRGPAWLLRTQGHPPPRRGHGSCCLDGERPGGPWGGVAPARETDKSPLPLVLVVQRGSGRRVLKPWGPISQSGPGSWVLHL